jgi:heme oxygenase (biliverdin-IX-beta and delta-forming)
MSFVATLRAATAVDHERVDAAFGAMRLDERDDYRRMLTAHAVEAALIRADPAWGLPAWTPRTPLLVSDLAALDVGMPDPLPFDLPEQEAATWGALYVAEGSRLGGQVLARGIAAGLPHAYLSARHAPGAWRALLASLDARATLAPPAWHKDVVDGAKATFSLFMAAQTKR